MAEKFIQKEVNSLISFQLTTIIQYLKNPERYFRPNGISVRDQLLSKAFTNAINNLKIKLGPSPSQWVYGQEKYKHIRFEHQLSDLVDETIKNKFNIGPLPRGGNGQTPGSTGGRDNQQSGASFRMLVDTKDWDETRKWIRSVAQRQLPYGPSPKRASLRASLRGH